METENWINEILNSTNGMTQVAPSDDLLERINAKIAVTKTVSNKTVWLVAASIIILLGLNIGFFVNETKTESKSSAYLEKTFNKSNQLY
jgi:hypothetical protein